MAISIISASCANLPEFDGRTFDRISAPFDNPDDSPTDSAPLKIAVLDVGQGDSTLIMAPTGETILVDAGPPNAGYDVIIPFLDSFEISTLTYIIATHYHSDHIGGTLEVLAGPDATFGTDDDIIPKKGIYDRGDSNDAGEQGLYAPYAAETADIRHEVEAGEYIRIGDMGIEFMSANGRIADGTNIDLGDPIDENAAGITMAIEFNGFRMFIGADLTGGCESPDIETPLAPLIGKIDVLRVSHHGSRTSTNQTLLDETRPEVAIISVGDENDFSHPHPSVIERLVESGVEIYQTERGYTEEEDVTIADGNIIIEVARNGSYEIQKSP